MSFRAKVSAVAVTTATCLLFAPTALASTHGPAQVTGKQLKSALLPPSDFVAGYTVGFEHDSGSKLEQLRVFNVPSMRCRDFWLFAGVVPGFGETAMAENLVDDKTGTLNPQEIFSQSVYQFASTRAAASFLAKVNAKYRSCPSVSGSDGNGGTLRRTVHSETKRRVGGRQALQVIEYDTDSKTPGPALPVYLLWTTDGTDIYFISTALPGAGSPKPTQSSLTLKLIARVRALR